MRIQNETSYRTDDLKKLLIRGFRAEGVKHRGYTIRISYTRGRSFSSGYAYYNSKTMCVRLASPATVKEAYSECDEKDKRTEPDILDFARVFVHELGHCLGLHHNEMVNSRSIDVPWIEGLQIRTKVTKVKPKVDIKIVRFKLAQKLLSKHESKMKREQKLVKKYRQKVRYYERTLGKAACDVKETPSGSVSKQGGAV